MRNVKKQFMDRQKKKKHILWYVIVMYILHKNA